MHCSGKTCPPPSHLSSLPIGWKAEDTVRHLAHLSRDGGTAMWKESGLRTDIQSRAVVSSLTFMWERNIYFVWAIIIQSLCLLKTNLFPKYIYTKFLTLPLQTFIVGGLWWSPKYLYFLTVSQGIYFDVPTVWGATELQMAQKSNTRKGLE